MSYYFARLFVKAAEPKRTYLETKQWKKMIDLVIVVGARLKTTFAQRVNLGTAKREGEILQDRGGWIFVFMMMLFMMMLRCSRSIGSNRVRSI